MANHDKNNSNNDTHESKSDKESPSLLPPQAAATPPPSTDDTASLLSPWWSEQTATTEEIQPTATEKTSNTNNSSESNNSSSTHKHTILIGLNRNMEHNDDKEISWKEKCYVFANVPKLKYEGKSDRENLEKLFDYSRECTMVCFLRESRKLARQRLLLTEENTEKKTSDIGFTLNPFYGTWISVAKTPKRCREHILGVQAFLTKKDYPDYYTIDLGEETKHSSEHVSRVIHKAFGPLQHLSQRYIDSWNNGTQQAFFHKFWTRLERGDAFYLVRDCTKRLIENVLEDKKPSDKK
ncbi:hypothetical protein G6F70_007168 [Rhizopus microsporus]|uniref:Uncharacterized protein n=2 Tax=Rhizopus TaxID=4842 RepID=A0A367K260_RHIAZ|nr:hypothetical protein G6F71_005817 [Rhizopus microsporus]RCH96283.1 hypothetical protein CU097_001253 [Rhizopus azygosporus]KAG1196772.1 hypothetical protein G6F70_007168 [Rhizopus microsporus]KAG1209990.1 hypothetical protein G6F69_005879 [Rhizopus microsporus]KAG1228164.1 hypothetical protein G6F67_007997 [Rhizopus microsporus]